VSYDFVRVTFDNVEATSERAICITIDGVQHWVPRSQIEEPDELEPSFGPGDCMVKEWFVDKEGLV